ncbi:MAG TPA: translation elongation factor EF-1 subunit alpha [Thermoplasmata archaeon]|jgi:elongation factor 1-alpha|nr:translation elongation factor EF-1 subunit alpha [Thermoplasmata archaeon]
MATKPHLNIVFIGHVDHGKSTTVGRILFDTGHVDAHILEGFKKEAEQKGKATFEFAWVMDRVKEERERGLTIDVAHQKFETDKIYFTIIDAPGHRDFVKNMITGTSQADGAVLVVSAAEGVQAQTKEHIFLARTLGVQQLIVAVNKMDATKPAFNEARFKEIKTEVSGLLKAVGYKTDEILFVPISSYKGDNITKASPNLGWYKGPSIVESLNTLKEPPKPTEKPLRVPIQDVYSITGIGTVPVGRIETGVLKPGMKVSFQPADKVGEVKSIEMHHEQIAEALPGDNVGFNVRGVDKNDIRRGDVAGPVDNPPSVAKSFTAQIIVLNHPSVITPGYTPVFHAHTAQVACTFEELLKKLDQRTGETKEEKPEFLKTGDAAIVKIRPTKPMVIEPFKQFPQMGRFAIRDMGQTVAAGQVIDVEKQ